MATETPIQAAEVQPFRLIPAVDPEGHAEAVMPTTWCFSEEMMDELLTGKMRDAHILIVVTHDGRERLRLLVPWREQMRHIPFDIPGDNTVLAVPVWPGEDVGVEKMRSILMGKFDSGSGYRCTVLEKVPDPYGEDEPRPATWTTADGSHRAVTVIGKPVFHEESEENYYAIEGSASRLPASQLEFKRRTKQSLRKEYDHGNVQRLEDEWTQVIDIEEGHFAKEPPNIAKRLIAFSIPGKAGRPKDSCQLGWRIIGALAAFLPIVLWTTLKMLGSIIVVAALMILGKRGINYATVTHPRHRDPRHAWTNLGSSVWWDKKDGEHTSEIFLVLNPPVFIVLSVIVGVLKTFVWTGIRDEQVPLLALGAIVAIIVGTTMVVMVIACGEAAADNRLIHQLVSSARKVSNPMSHNWSALQTARQARWIEKDRATMARENEELRQIAQTLSCGNREVPPSIEEVVNPSLELRVSAYKYRHCRPYSRG